MKTVVARRLVRLPVLLFLLSAALFFALHVGPRTPQAYTGVDVTEERRLSIGGDFTFRTKLVDDYRTWIPDSIIGDLGESGFYDQPVLTVLRARATPTLLLLAAALLLTYGIGIPLSARSIRRRGKSLDLLTGAFSGVGAAVPTFVLALGFGYLLTIRTSLLPTSGFRSASFWQRESARFLVLPVIALTIPLLSEILRLSRGIIRTSTRSSYARSARGMGIPERSALIGHHLRNALSPVAASLGAIAVRAVAGVIVVEYLFDIPGLGRLFLEAIDRRDFAIIQGIALVTGCGLLLVLLLSEILAARFDPRLRPA